jgi:uncharacterized membrane protein YfhO
MPGWRAWVDGKPSPVFLADGIFQAVPMDAVSRTVQLAYEPASFRLGAFLSLVSLATALFFACGGFPITRTRKG